MGIFFISIPSFAVYCCLSLTFAVFWVFERTPSGTSATGHMMPM